MLFIHATIIIVNDITNFCFRFLPNPYMEAFSRPKAKFLISLTMHKMQKQPNKGGTII